ncbi:hypothetical protein MMC17_003948 [Xylographa soralifera]|nr:hypothetical protein [Xylographa soralifera]
MDRKGSIASAIYRQDSKPAHGLPKPCVTSPHLWFFSDLVSMTGRDRWDRSTLEQRETFYDLLYQSGPYAMIFMSLGRAAIIVPLRDSFSDMDSELHFRWRTLHKTMLTWSLEAVWIHVVQPKDEAQPALNGLYMKWKSWPTHDLIGTLNLKDILDIPVKVSGILDIKDYLKIGVSTDIHLPPLPQVGRCIESSIGRYEAKSMFAKTGSFRKINAGKRESG